MLLNPFVFAGGGGGGGHRYWRLLISANDGGSVISVLELQMRESKHGLNACVGGTADASSSLLITGSPALPTAAFNSNWDDGATSGFFWASDTATNEWISYDFGSAKSIVAVDLWSRATNFNQTPTDFDVQHSDDNSSWTTAWSVTGSTTWRSREHRKYVDPSHTETVFTMGSHTYWRILTTENHGAGSNTGIGELEFRSVIGVSQGSTGGTPLASSTLGGNVAANAFAGDGGTTFWTSSQGPANGNAQELQYQHTSARDVFELMLQARNDAFRTEHPKYFQLLWSDNGTDWTHGADCQSLTAWGLNEIRLFDVTPA